MKRRIPNTLDDKLLVFYDEYYQLAHFRILCDCGWRLAVIYRDRAFAIAQKYGMVSKSQIPRKYALEACPFIFDMLKENQHE